MLFLQSKENFKQSDKNTVLGKSFKPMKTVAISIRSFFGGTKHGGRGWEGVCVLAREVWIELAVIFQCCSISVNEIQFPNSQSSYH